MLSDSDSDDIHNSQLTVNEHYAKAFQYRKEREELEKLKAKLGSDISESDVEEGETDSESAESEDEDGEELTPVVGAAILRTLARIKRKDPSIYESGKDIFGEEQERIPSGTAFIGPRKNQKDQSKPITLRQVALEAQLNPSRSPSPEPLTHVQEQRALRKEAISAFHTSVAGNGDEDDDNDLLVPREKTKDEQEREEQEYRAFLEREVGDLKEIVGALDAGDVDEETHHAIETSPKRQSKKKAKKGKEDQNSAMKQRKSKEEENQEFLVNYILGRGWIDKSKNHIPTYKEVTSKHKPKKAKHQSASNADSDHSETDTDIQKPTTASNANANEETENLDALSDSSFDSLADAFESSYNFRFEEPSGALIPSFPRNIPSLVRREDNKRKDARERRKKRKEEEVQKKKEEVRRMKALKMREVRRKLEIIGREGGILGSGREGKGKDVVAWDGESDGQVDAALLDLDLEGDWDPEEHDKQMAGLFTREGDWEDVGEVDQDGKPVWEDDIDIGDISIQGDDAPVVGKRKKDKKKKKGGEGLEDEGVDVDAMDADVQALGEMEVGEDEDEEWDGTEEMRKRKLDEYMEEIYNLDFNDMVGDMPTRFKYTSIASQTYSLSPVEVLMATDKELNEFMSIKKYAPYRNDARKWDAKRQQRLKELRATIAKRIEASGGHVSTGMRDTAMGEWEARGGERAKKRKGKKERLREKAGAASTEAQAEEQDEGLLVSDGGNADAIWEGKDREKEKVRKRERNEITEVGVGTQQNESGKPKKKRRRKHKHGVEDSLVQVEQ